MNKMVNKTKELREKYLKGIDGKNKKTQKNWEKLSKRFGKKRLLELFGAAQTKINNKSIKYVFYNNIQNQLKQNKNLLYLAPKTYNTLKYLFKNFCDFYEKQQNQLIDILSIDNKNKSKIKTQLKLNFVFSDEKSMLRPSEKSYMDITSSGDVVAPGDRRDDD